MLGGEPLTSPEEHQLPAKSLLVLTSEVAGVTDLRVGGEAQGSPRKDTAKPSESLLFLSLSLIWVVSRATLLASDSSKGRGPRGWGRRDRSPGILGWPFLACQPFRGVPSLRLPGSPSPLNSGAGFSSRMLGAGWREAKGDRGQSGLAHSALGGTWPQLTLGLHPWNSEFQVTPWVNLFTQQYLGSA